MTIQEKLNALEEMLELDENTLSADEKLEDIEEWDSMSKLYLASWVKKNLQRRLSIDEVKNFKTVQDICDYMG